MKCGWWQLHPLRSWLVERTNETAWERMNHETNSKSRLIPYSSIMICKCLEYSHVVTYVIIRSSLWGFSVECSTYFTYERAEMKRRAYPELHSKKMGEISGNPGHYFTSQTSLCVDFANSPVPLPCSIDRLEQSGLGIQYRRTTLETIFINQTSDVEGLTAPCLQSLPWLLWHCFSHFLRVPFLSAIPQAMAFPAIWPLSLFLSFSSWLV
jgi:hypothetical protein